MQLAVIGGGPKAAALAAKATALAARKIKSVQVTIFEPAEIGAAWTGQHGYTDGEALLCTPAERDLGFPYYPDAFGGEVAQILAERFSWQAFLVDRQQYARWLERGRKAPRHGMYAEYLAWAVTRSDAEVVKGAVMGLRYDMTDDRWEVSTNPPEAAPSRRYDGVVVTGSGEPLPPISGADKTVRNGASFWQERAEVLAALNADLDPSVVVIGAGGTAGAIVLWLLENIPSSVPIRIIGREPTLYTRAPGYFEDRLFADTEQWRALSAASKRAFLSRVGVGVLWERVVEYLAEADNLTYHSAEASHFRWRETLGEPGHGELQLAHGDASSPPHHFAAATVFVDARGFDAWWFAELLPLELRGFLNNKITQDALLDNIDETLAFAYPFPYRHLHVPMLASMQGPASGNLMALGLVSDQILRAYPD